jgi:signal transduction histidine kinase
VENGIKYNRPGGRLSVRLNRDGDNAVVQVIDSGVGIPEDAVEHVFERFFRVDKARARKSGGSGLGLAIVKNLVERNQGTIEVSSIPDQGTTFTLSFPIFETSEEDA